MSDVLEILKRGSTGLEALLRSVLLDADDKVPAERLRIVGALSAGNIIESGSNANGYWIKLADGTLIMQGRYDISSSSGTTIAIDNAYLGHFYSDMITFPLPCAYYNETSGSLAVGQNPGWGNTNKLWFWGGVAADNKVSVRLYSSQSTTISSLHLQWVFIGRWKA